MRTMTFPLPYEIIAPGGYVMDKITHKIRCEQWTAIINECLASGMPKTTWCRANGISDKQFFYWQRILRQEAYQQMESQSSSPASSALVLNDKKEQASHPAFVEIRPDAMPEEESTVFRPDVIIRSGNLVMEISNTASEELIRKIRGLFHV